MALTERIGVFGGSFDPPHVCHVLVCHYVVAIGEVDRVLLVPAHLHPFGKPLTPFAHRLAMCRMTVGDGQGKIEVSDMEARRRGPSFMIDTVRALRAERPETAFRLIIGSDILGETERWKSFDELRRLAPPLVVPRGPNAENRLSFAFPPVSSTEIREALRQGKDVSAVLSPRVRRYIQERDLYRVELSGD
ncbi:MAG: nicotinate (nicotinamide) nucleotide adenylyltransferase [Candidatus Sumerlaeota bacterium]|nr:nicotinate (nicotinamide) nucleotide adenylyltransferase [Candidatus Sumerlaeota bacterium]